MTPEAAANLARLQVNQEFQWMRDMQNANAVNKMSSNFQAQLDQQAALYQHEINKWHAEYKVLQAEFEAMEARYELKLSQKDMVIVEKMGETIEQEKLVIAREEDIIAKKEELIAKEEELIAKDEELLAKTKEWIETELDRRASKMSSFDYRAQFAAVATALEEESISTQTNLHERVMKHASRIYLAQVIEHSDRFSNGITNLRDWCDGEIWDQLEDEVENHPLSITGGNFLDYFPTSKAKA